MISEIDRHPDLSLREDFHQIGRRWILDVMIARAGLQQLIPSIHHVAVMTILYHRQQVLEEIERSMAGPNAGYLKEYAKPLHFNNHYLPKDHLIQTMAD